MWRVRRAVRTRYDFAQDLTVRTRVKTQSALPERFLTPAEAAQLLACSTRALDRLDAAGFLEKVHVFAVGPRYRHSEVARILAEGTPARGAA